MRKFSPKNVYFFGVLDKLILESRAVGSPGCKGQDERKTTDTRSRT